MLVNGQLACQYIIKSHVLIIKIVLTTKINKPYLQLHHKIKMAQRVWVLCTQNLWRELHFEMLTMKNARFHSGEAYYPPSDVGSRIFELFETF